METTENNQIQAAPPSDVLRAAADAKQISRRAYEFATDIENRRKPLNLLMPSEIHRAADAVKLVAEYCRYTDDVKPLRGLNIYREVWAYLLAWSMEEAKRDEVVILAVNNLIPDPTDTPHRSELWLMVEALQCVFEALCDADNIPSEIRAAKAMQQSDKIIKKQAEASARRLFEPIAENRLISANPTAPEIAANTLFDTLCDNNFIDYQNRKKQCQTWLYLWNLSEYPTDLTPINWVADVGLLAYLMGEICRTRHGRNKITAAAFVYNSKPIVPRTLTQALNHLNNQTSQRIETRFNTLISLINNIIGAMS